MTFGDLFELLFIDSKCMSEIKDWVKKSKFSSASLIRQIKEIEENTLWKKLFSDGAVSDFEAEYDTVRKHRNDVMHAHNVTYTSYKEALKLIQMINQELDSEIGKTIGLKESKQSASNVDYNKVINETIAVNKTLDSIRSAFEDYRSQIDETIPAAIKWAEYQREMQDFLEYKKLIEIEQSPAMAEIRKMQMIDPSVYALASALSSISPKSEDKNKTVKACADDGESNSKAQDTTDKKDDKE